MPESKLYSIIKLLQDIAAKVTIGCKMIENERGSYMVKCRKIQRGYISIVTAFMMVFAMLFAPLAAKEELQAYSSDMRQMTAAQIVADMGAGWNMGNSLESENDETGWGNPRITKQMVQAIANRGFSTIRIPVRWDDNYSNSSNYTIKSSYLDRVEEVVNYGLDCGLYVIINVHHNDLQTKANYNSSDQWQVKQELKAIWTQVGNRFKNYGDKLVFEVNNEPRNGDNDWNGDSTLYNVVNEYNEAGRAAIRATGGNNAKRLVMLPTYCASADEPKVAGWKNLSSDNMIAVSIHAYHPFDFAFQGDGHNDWTDDDYNQLKGTFNRLNQYFVSKGVPVVIGEFGCTNKNNLNDRVKAVGIYANMAKELGMASIIWDNNNDGCGGEYFKIFDRNSLTFTYDGIAGALVNAYKDKPVYSTEPSVAPSETPAGNGFYVNGTKIYDANNQEFMMRGVNVPYAWYKGDFSTAIDGIAAKGANTVRVVLGDGQTYDKTSASELSSIIQKCKEKKMICIVEVHDATGKDDTNYLNTAVNYWKEMKDILNENQQYVILNIANEWYGTWNASGWASGYKSAIKSIRNAGIKNMLMVDCAGWGQYPDSIKEKGKSVFDADSLKNTVFSIHMYEYSGADYSTVYNNIQNVLNLGVPVVIGEFGQKHTNGDVDEDAIMSICKEKGVGYLGWSWKGNGSDYAYLDLSNDWSGNSLTDWGNRLFNGNDGIASTSVRCSVFGGGTPTNTPAPTKTPVPTSTADGNSVLLFSGSASASNWKQAVEVETSKNGGAFDASNIKKGGNFYVEYSGTKDQVELIFQSWSGGSEWGKVQISESGSVNGHYFAKFSYENCVSAFGNNDFSGKLDKVFVGAAESSVTVYSVKYVFGNASGESGESDPYISIFWGNATASGWEQPVGELTAKNGGKFDASKITSNGYFYVEYSGQEKDLDLVLQSWSGGSEWAKVSISETGYVNGHNYAKYSYDNCVNAFGTSDFSGKLDKILVSARESSITVYSVCYCYSK
ncbi:MAG TPA: hypothetical protein DCW90_00805 [Lachnospiraceae bacterium]|nr:hypothetical protein [Lachnospiraceae bacterium]